MPDIAIRVENLSKRYRIGRAQQRHDTLRDALVDLLPRVTRIRRIHHSNNSWQEKDDTIWALKDVSFEVKRGEVVGIIGRNGAGKSTLLKILSRITEPTEGRARIRGRVASLLEVGTGFHPELTGRENIYLNGAILGMRRAEIDRKFDEIVAFAEIERFLDTPVKRYSSGMYVRLAFAVAAHLEPEQHARDAQVEHDDGDPREADRGELQIDAGQQEGVRIPARRPVHPKGDPAQVRVVLELARRGLADRDDLAARVHHEAGRVLAIERAAHRRTRPPAAASP